MKTILVTLMMAASASAVAGENNGPPAALGHLRTNDRVVTLWAGEQPRYTVRTKDGKLLADKITAAELRSRYPDLYRINDATTVAWAGL